MVISYKQKSIGLQKVCITCNNIFFLNLHKQKRSQKFCSTKCIRTGTPPSRKGLKHTKESILKMLEHPNRSKFSKGHTFGFVKGHTPWNKGKDFGGQGLLRKKIMGLSMYKAWRNSVKKIHGLYCEQCATTQAQFHVDHFPVSFAVIIKQNSILTVDQARVCGTLWDINNARVLCFDCHKLTESYGRNIEK